MKIILSPAKKMKIDTDGMPWQELPVFVDRAEKLCGRLQSMSYGELKKLWACNDSIAEQNVQRLQGMNLRERLTPAVLAYEGIAYQYMAPGVFTDREYTYIQEHLRILSGFYGVLRPFDGVTPYRMEMQAKLSVDGAKDLYAFWGSSLAEQVCQDTDCVLNLASKEYSICISRHLPEAVRFVTCIFGEEKEGKIIEKGTLCKMARGEMVRFLAEHQITDLDSVKDFDRLGYRYVPERSDEKQLVFLRSEC